MSADFEVTATGLEGLARSLRNASPELHKAMRSALKSAAKPIAAAEQAQALALDSSGGSSGGSAAAERVAWYLRKRKKVTDRTVRSAMRTHSGLRAAMARAIVVQYREAGREQGVKVVALGSKMPPSQRALLRASTREKGWRHPVYGGKTWVEQRMTPGDWWRRTGDRELPGARRDIEQEFQRWADRLAAHARSGGS